MKIKRKGSAAWQGGIKDGKGSISTESGALSAYPYGFASRFEGQKGSNPEELIAAAHASCFTMALSKILGEAKLTAERMETSAEVTLEQVDGGWAVTASHLTLKAKVPRRGRRDLPESRRQGEGRLPNLEAAKGRDLPRGESNQLNRRACSWRQAPPCPCEQIARSNAARSTAL